MRFPLSRGAYFFVLPTAILNPMMTPKSPFRGPLRSLLLWELVGVLPIALVGATLHFAFEWSGGWRPLALIAAVNESVWEHMKLAFWPGIAWAALGALLRSEHIPRYWFAKSIGLLFVPLAISILYYGYKPILEHNILWLDIAIFVVAIFLGQLSTVVILRYSTRAKYMPIVGRILLTLQLAAYGLFTYFPPHLPLFQEIRSGLYGIPL